MTIEDLAKRRSVRSYVPKPLLDSDRKTLEALITDINTHEAGMHLQLFTDSGAPFEGFRRSYGMFRGVKNYVALVVDNSYPFMREKAGYYGEQIVMKAVELGLGTCFVGGTFSSGHVDARVRAGEELLCLIVLGYADEAHTSLAARLSRKIAKRRSKKPEDFFKSDISLLEAEKLFPALGQGLEAVALAPSALNKQPVEIGIASDSSEALNGSANSVSEDGVTVTATVPEDNPMQLIDLGIAMFNFQAVVSGYWDWGLPAVFRAE